MKKKKLKKKTKIKLAILIGLWLMAIGTICYPLAIRFVGQTQNNQTISGYNATASQISKEQKEAQFAQARLYNKAIYANQMGFGLSDEEENALKNYKTTLKIGNSEMMGEVAIPSIDTDLPIFHGTGDSALESGIGHLTFSSLPIGGENTRAVLTGHSGLTSSKLFTRLDELGKGDKFYIKIFDEIHAYRVSRIEVIEKEDVKALQIDPGQDEVSLVTCYPFGQNTHRLVVTGRRTKYNANKLPAMQKGVPASWHEMLTYALPISLVVLLLLMIFKKIREKRSRT